MLRQNMPHREIMCRHTRPHLLKLLDLRLSIFPGLLVFDDQFIFDLSNGLHSFKSGDEWVVGYVGTLEFVL